MQQGVLWVFARQVEYYCEEGVGLEERREDAVPLSYLATQIYPLIGCRPSTSSVMRRSRRRSKATRRRSMSRKGRGDSKRK